MILIPYCHFCKWCRKYHQCTDPDPEKKVAICPSCSRPMNLQFQDLESTKKQIGLAADEIGTGNVTYRNL